MDKLPVTKLNDGQLMPILGLGTSRLDDTYAAVRSALKLGYRHIDTAAMYGNEQEVGRAVRDSGLKREDVFVTTKLANIEHGKVEAAVERSLKRLGLDYIDLYLIHWPAPARLKSWHQLEQMMAAGVPIKSIGVSNFTPRHIKELLAVARIEPAVNQIEFHPFVYQPTVLKFNQDLGIQIVSYSPLTRGNKLDNGVLKQVAKDVSRSTQQVLLRWCIQHKVVVIPKSDSAEHQHSNMDIFNWELSPAQMAKLDKLYDGFRVTEDPETYV